MQIDKMHTDFVQNSLILITLNYAPFVLSTAQHIFNTLFHKWNYYKFYAIHKEKVSLEEMQNAASCKILAY